MPQKILGIDVGSHSIKVAEISRSFRTFQLVGFYEQPIVFYDTLGREGSISQALLKLIEEYGIASELIFTALPGQATAHRTVDLPFSDFKKVDSTIEFEMENYLPLPIEELLIDYHILSHTKTNSAVLVSYAKKSEFIRFMNLLNEANVDPRFIGSEPVELANVMKMGVFQPEGAYALLDVGHEKTNVLIFNGSELQFARTIMMGGKDLSQAIADSLNIPLVEAERMKVELGQVGPDLDGADQTTKTISTALKSVLSELCLNLKQTFMAFQQTKGEVVQALVLCGGTSRLAGIDHYLSTELRKNVSFLDCLDFPFNQLADSNWCRPIAASALALAYRGVLGSGVKDIQFRRGEFAYKGEVKAITGFTKQVAVLLVVTTLFMIGSFVTSYVSLKGRSKRQGAQIQAVASQILPDLPQKTLSNPSAILSTLSGKVNEAEEKKKKIEEEASLSVMEILKQFSLALPKREQIQVDVDDLTIVENRIRVQGKTVSFEGVDQIKAALSQSKYFKNVATDNVKKGFKDDVRFSLSLEVAEGGGG